jgi:hypothetical protein
MEYRTLIRDEHIYVVCDEMDCAISITQKTGLSWYTYHGNDLAPFGSLNNCPILEKRCLCDSITLTLSKQQRFSKMTKAQIATEIKGDLSAIVEKEMKLM